MPRHPPSLPSALLVGEDALVRAGLREVLARGHWAVAGEVDSLAGVRAACFELSFDAVLWDAGHAAAVAELPEGPPLLALVEDDA
jgi:hypothetical protein